MIRSSLLSLALLVGPGAYVLGQRPAPPVVRPVDPCALYAQAVARPPVAGSARPQVQGPAVTPPVASSRIPSTYVRDYGSSAPAYPASELIRALPRQKLEVQEFRSGVEPSSPGPMRYYDVYPVSAEEQPVVPAGQTGQRAVRFWNLSERRLTLELGDTTYTLERGVPLALDLPPTFRWQIAGRGLESTELSAAAGAEIVIRR